MPVDSWSSERPSDEEIFDALCAKVKGRVPEFEIRYKSKSYWHRILGKLLFFNKAYMKRVTTTLRYNVWFPDESFVKDSKWLAFKILAHEYVHLLDRQTHPVIFEKLYAIPQSLFVFSLLALMAIWFSNWWLVSLVALIFLAPIPSRTRAELEMRAYAMGIAINMWRHGDVLPSTKEWMVETFKSWTYYRMCPYPDRITDWIDSVEQGVRNIDTVGSTSSILDLSEAYEDVYELLTGITFD